MRERKNEKASHKDGVIHIQHVMTVLRRCLKTMGSTFITMLFLLTAKLHHHQEINPRIPLYNDCDFSFTTITKIPQKAVKHFDQNCKQQRNFASKMRNLFFLEISRDLKGFYWSVCHRTGNQRWSSALRIEHFPSICSSSPPSLISVSLSFLV